MNKFAAIAMSTATLAVLALNAGPARCSRKARPRLW